VIIFLTMLLEELGVKRAINAWGTVTLLGGTTISDDVIDAMREASKVYVDMKELHKKAGDYIATMLGVEAACVVSGATAGLILSAAACMTGGETESILSLPRIGSKNNGGGGSSKNKILVQRLHRNPFVKSLGTAGAEVFFFGGEEKTTDSDLEEAIDAKVAAMMYFVFDPQPGVLELDRVVEISHRHRVPVIVDAASELPPMSNLKKFTSTGADIVVFSGGKAVGAPSDTGLVLGRRDLIETCVRLEYYENVGNETVALLGRSMKVSKEDVLAVVTALRQYLRRDHDADMKAWKEKVEYMISELSKSKKLPAPKLAYPTYGHEPRPLNIPRVALDFNADGYGIDAAKEMSNKLKSGDPPIYVYVKDNVLFLNPQCLQGQEEKVIVSRLFELAR
jgi:uncharacterized pyridoxal phosphate-dependent enzyme